MIKQSFLHLGLLHEDDDDFDGQAPEDGRVCLQRQHVPKHTFFHPLELLLKTNVCAQAQKHDELLLGLYFDDRLVHLHQKGSVLVCDRVCHQQVRLQLQPIVLLVGQHYSALVRYCLVYDDADHSLLGCDVLQNLFAEDSWEFHSIKQFDCVHVAFFADLQLPTKGGSFEDFLRVRGNDDIDGDSCFGDQVKFIFAVVGALPQQEETGVDCLAVQGEIEEADAGSSEGQDNFSILTWQYGAQVELVGQFQQ